MPNTLDHDCRLLFVQVRQRTAEIDRALKQVLQKGGQGGGLLGLLSELEQDAEVTPVLQLAFAGEYDVGKTSLINALTGANLKVDADVATDSVDKIPYRDGLVLVDMPGTLSGQVEHDRKARQAVVDSDLMLFVLTNELFNAASLPYFRRAMDEFRKERQTLIVVNQFDRVNLRGRTTEEAIALITTELAERVSPIPIDDLGPVFVSARNYLDAAHEEDPVERQQLLAESRMDTLVRAVDEFCLSRGPAGRLARPLQLRLRIVNDAISAVSSGDEKQQLAQECLHRRLGILEEEQRSFRLETRNMMSEVRHSISGLAEPVVACVERREPPDAIAAAWQDADVRAETIYTDAMERLETLGMAAQDRLADKLKALNESPAALALGRLLEGTLEGKGTARGPSNQRTGLFEQIAKKFGPRQVLEQGGKELVKRSAEISKTVVDWVAKFHKFRPWGKIKLSGQIGKWLGRFGKALGPLAIVVEAYMNYRDEEKAEARDRERLQFKAQVRAALAETADAAIRAIEGACNEIDRSLFGNMITESRVDREELAAAAGDKQQSLSALTRIDGEVREALGLLASATK